VPYPSFKGINLQKRAQIELMIAVVVGAAFLVTLPQVTVFLLASAFVLAGPYLMLRGERMSTKVPVLHPVQAEPRAAQPDAGTHSSPELPETH
jgi:hypothetical protein